MGVLDNFIERRGYQKSEAPVVKSAADLATGDSWAEIFGGGGSQAFSTFNSQKEQLNAYVDWVYAAVRYIAESCSTIDLRIFVNHTAQNKATLGQKLIYQPEKMKKLYKENHQVITKENGKLVTKKVPALEEIESHPLLDLLDCPNPYMTRIEFFEMTFLHLELAGEAFWAINRDKNGKGKPIELWPLMPNLVQVVADKEKFVIGYVYTVNGEKLPFAPEDIIHHKYSNPNDLRRGMSTVQAASRIIDTDTHMADYNRRIFYNGATVDAVLYTDNKLTDVNWRRLQSQWKDQYSGTQNAHRTAILENGLKYAPMALNNKDLDFLKGMEFNRDMILALFGVPKSLLGMDASMSRANAETAEYVFAKHKARPKMLRLTTRITEDLAIQFGDNIIVSFTDPVPDDKEFLLKEKQTSLGTNAALGWRTINEVREEDGDDSIEGGDELWISGTMLPISRAAEEPEDEPTDTTDVTDPNAPDDTSEPDDEDINEEEDDGEDNNNSSAGESGSTTSDTSSGDKSLTGKKKDSSPVVHAEESAVNKANERPHKTQQELKDNQEQFEIIRDGIVEVYESKFLKVSHVRFEQQRLEVRKTFTEYYNSQKSLKPRSKGLKDIITNLFDKHKSELLWGAALVPIYKSAVNQMGQAAMDNVLNETNTQGTPNQFSTANASIANYYENRSTLISKGIDDETQKLLATSLGAGISGNESLSELIDRVEGVYGAASGYRAERIARTESIASTTRATLEGWEQSGVVEGKMWKVGSFNPCKYCLDMDGKIIRLGENYFEKGSSLTVAGAGTMKLDYDDVPGPPVHVNCACTLMAVLAGTYDFDAGAWIE